MVQVLLYHKPQFLPLHLAHPWLGAGGPAETCWGYWGSPAGISWPCQGKSFHFLCPVPGKGHKLPQLSVTFSLGQSQHRLLWHTRQVPSSQGCHLCHRHPGVQEALS